MKRPIHRLVHLLAMSAMLTGVAYAKPRKKAKRARVVQVTPVEATSVEAPIEKPSDLTAAKPVVVASTQSVVSDSPVTDETRVVDTAGDRDAPTTTDTGLVPELKSGSMRVKVYGSIRPTAGIAYHSTAIERDRLAYGVTGSRLDLGSSVKVGGGVSAELYVRLGAETDGNGNTVGEIELERALVVYQPVEFFKVAVGRDSIPLSAQSATPTYARTFPNRIRLDSTYVLPADVGAQAGVYTDYVTGLVGVWNGIGSDTTNVSGASPPIEEMQAIDDRGLLYSGRLEVTPLGPFGFDERERPDTLRVGVGAAATYRAATEFTPTGTAGRQTRDLRATLSVRAAYRGLYVQAEALRRQTTDDLSMRPDVATAGYVQASYRIDAGKLDIAPLARVGREKQRELSAPGDYSSTELGVAVYPLARGSDRLQLTAIGTRYADPILGAQYEVTTVASLGF